MVPTALLLIAMLPVTLPAATPEDVPPPFEEVCFGDFDDERGYPGPELLQETFEPVKGGKLNLRKSTHHARTIYELKGLFRLKPRWEAGSAWRLAVHDSRGLQLHFWHGQQGVTLRYYPNLNRTWAAYGTTRSGNGPEPETYALRALDNGRYYRSRAGTFELRWQDGKLVMTRGDLVLLCVPLGGRPAEVFLQCEAVKFRGLAMLSSAPAPLKTVSRPVVRRIDRPADLDWRTRPPNEQDGDPHGPNLNKLPDGRVELVAEKNSRAVEVETTICRPGLYEYLLEIEDAEPGTGLYLADEEGKPIHRLAFFRDRRTGRTTFGPVSPDSGEIERDYDFKQTAVPYAGRRQWVRLVLGAGILKCATSGDGVHFSDVFLDTTEVAGACTTLGLYCLPGDKRRAIKLRGVELRRLALIESLALEEIMPRIGPLGTAADFEGWQQRVAEAGPSDVPADRWRRACCLHAIRNNVTHTISQPALHQLLQEVLAESSDWQFKLRLLDEAALLVHFLNYGDYWSSPKYGTYYQQLGRELLRGGHPTPSATAGGAAMRIPGWTIQCRPFDRELLRDELLTLAQQQRWQEVAEFCRRTRYWTRISEHGFYWLPWDSGKETTTHLLNWGAAAASLHAANPPPGRSPNGTADFRHPLIVQIDKESYNVMGEFRGALDGGAYREACQIVSASAASWGLGLMPDDKDRRLLVSLPAAVDLAMLRVPQLGQAMRQDFGPLAGLRINRAVADGDPQAAQAVSVQFRGTEAAAQAHRWLGDRALSAGRFAQAYGHYQRALQGLAADGREQLRARLRLAAAMMGRDAGQPVTAPVSIGSSRFSATQFEQMVRQAREAHGGRNSHPSLAGDGVAAQFAACPPAGDYETRTWARIDAGRDKDPGGLPKEGFDWAARQVAVALTADRMIVNNQVQQAAFDLSSGRRRWHKQQDLRSRAAGWSMAAMRPLIDGGRIFVRRLSDKGPELACFDLDDGKLLWNNYPDGPVVSDPLLAGRELLALTACRCEPGDELSLELAAFEPHDGRLLRRSPLAQFRNHWFDTISCRATAAGDKIVATTGGTVLCCDLSGRVRWIRRQIYAPPGKHLNHASQWLKQVHNPPLVSEDRVYATQPGVWGIECIESRTGRILWRTAMPNLLCLAGRIAGRLIAETTHGLAAVDTDSGQILWRHDAEDRLDTRVCGGGDAVCCVRLGRESRPVLAWIDPETGRVTAEATLDVSMEKDRLRGCWGLGPLVVHGGRQWVFTPVSKKPADREIRELVLVKRYGRHSRGQQVAAAVASKNGK